MAARINVDTVIELVSHDIHSAIEQLVSEKRGPAPPSADFWRDAVSVSDPRRGYLQQLHEGGLADWAAEHATVIHLLVRPGDYVFPDAPIAIMKPMAEGVDAAINDATALGSQRGGSADLEFAVRQLVEVAVRALSPGINDPFTAMSVLDRLGTALCDLVPLHVTTGVSMRDGRVVLVVPIITYDGLVDSMFHMIRQNAAKHVAVLMRLLEVLTAVASCERDPDRIRALSRHADLVLGDAERDVATPADLAEIRTRYAKFVATTSRA